MKPSHHLNAVQTLTVSFAGLIALGAVLLALPGASRDGRGLPLLDALFTAASASCVTGLTVGDTYTQFSLFGQAVILLLIQVGGLSFMVVSLVVPFLLGQRIGLRQRSMLMDTVGALKLGGVVRLTRRALLCTALLEGVGALVLTTYFCPQFGFWQGLWQSLFHAVSAFCNAGFDLCGIIAPGTSLQTLLRQPLVLLTLALLVILGGLGFVLWDDLAANGLHARRYRLHTKLVLSTTGLLLLIGTAAFYAMERNGAFAGCSTGQALLLAFFQAVTPRTAGFATVPMNALSQGGTLLTMALMFVGAGSGSTGGGIKVGTFAVLVLSVTAYARRREDLDVFHRRLDEDTVRKALSTVCLYAMALLAGCMVLCLQEVPLEDALFEAVSAIGTVGLSRGLTPNLKPLSKLAVIALMFAGRVGSMSVAMSLTRSGPAPKLRNVREKILIG
ncbi:MAG: potassium transporter TrkG [Oscillibacter sp.]